MRRLGYLWREACSGNGPGRSGFTLFQACSFKHLLTGSEARNAATDRCSTPSRRGFNRVRASECRRAFGFQWFRQWNLRGLPTNIICSSGGPQRDAWWYFVSELIRPARLCRRRAAVVFEMSHSSPSLALSRRTNGTINIDQAADRTNSDTQRRRRVHGSTVCVESDIRR